MIKAIRKEVSSIRKELVTDTTDISGVRKEARKEVRKELV